MTAINEGNSRRMRASRTKAVGLLRGRIGLALSLVLGWLIVQAAWAAPPPASHSPSPMGAVGLIGVRLGGDAQATRVVLDLDAAVSGRVMTSESTPGHLVIALPSMLSTGRLQGPGQGLVAGWSVQDDGRGAKLILALAPGATASHRFLIPPASEGGRWRYVIDVVAGDPLEALVTGATQLPRPARQAVIAAATPTPRPIPTPPPAEAAPAVLAASIPTDPAPQASSVGPSPAHAQPGPQRTVLAARTPPPRGVASRSLKVIVVDAGHGGHDPGARSLVRNEKDITLAAALTLKAQLEKIGRYKVVLTRDSDVFIPLETRVQIARHAGADLFISLHADSAGSDPTPHGASVYTLSDSGQTRVNYVLGPHEWFSHTGDARNDADVRQILLDLTQRSTRNRSSQFAAILLDHIGERVDLLPRSHRDAGYFVLLAPDVPAVLLEMGFITNPSDELRLTDPVQRDALMSGVAQAIDAYFTTGARVAAD